MSNLTAWLEPCLVPLPHQPCGENPRYLEAFEKITMQLESLNGCDYAQVTELCHDLLVNTTKDLRIAGYLCISLTQLHGFIGLQTGLRLYIHFILEFGERLHPQSTKARYAAFAWLNSPRLLALIKQLTLSSEEYKQLSHDIEQLNASIIQTFSHPMPILTIFDEWLTQQIAITVPTDNESNDIEHCDEKSPPILTPEAQQMQLIIHWQSEKKWLLACKMARALRWGTLDITDNVSCLSALSPPRKEALEQLENIDIYQNPEAILELSESTFLEPGGSLHLDLQWYSYQAAIVMSQNKLASYIYQTTQWLSQNYPQLPEGKFNNDQAFANNVTRDWLQQKQPSPQPLYTPNELLHEITNKTDKQALSDILKQLQAFKSNHPLESFYQLQAKARASIQARQYHIALIFYETLIKKIDELRLAFWHPDQALEMWAEVNSFLHQHMKKLEGSHLYDLIHTIQSNMCQIDDYRASLFLESVN